MKNVIFLALFAFMFFACGGGSSEPGSGASNVQSVKSDEFTLTELPGGFQRAVKYGPDGTILEEGILKNGKRNGSWIVYNTRKPIPASVANFIDDVYSGPYIQYSSVGQVELLCHYIDNKLDGEFTKYKNSRVLEEGYYKNGQYEGLYKRYYPGKEVLQQEATYKDGQLHGKTRYYNEAGEVIMEYEYVNGEKISGGIVKNEN